MTEDEQDERAFLHEQRSEGVVFAFMFCAALSILVVSGLLYVLIYLF